MNKININETLLDKELYCAYIFGLPIIICNYKTAKKLLKISNQRNWPDKYKYKGADIYIDENINNGVFFVFTTKIKEKFLKLENYEREKGK